MSAVTLWDIDILLWIKANIWCPFLDFLMPLITYLGEYGAFWIAVAAIMLCSKKYRKIGIMLGISYIFGIAFGNGVLKNLVARERPYTHLEYETFQNLTLLIKTPWDYSFPSGHTLVCFEASGVLMFTKRKPLGYIALAIGIAVAFSRIYLLVHYPTDVFGGMILGFVFGIFGYLLGNLLCKAITKKYPNFCEM
ncbi:MAG: phosphatase PAP2 family protein [Clostridia bacterium]|nr:phosphatase PAP2 family protein [Clostridia bacterium]